MKGLRDSLTLYSVSLVAGGIVVTIVFIVFGVWQQFIHMDRSLVELTLPDWEIFSLIIIVGLVGGFVAGIVVNLIAGVRKLSIRRAVEWAAVLGAGMGILFLMLGLLLLVTIVPIN